VVSVEDRKPLGAQPRAPRQAPRSVPQSVLPARRQPAYDHGMTAADQDREDALRALVDEYRDRCLWFLRKGYSPATAAERLRVLDSLQRHGDVSAFQRAGELRRWVLAATSEASANS